MAKTIKLNKGLDIKLLGEANQSITEVNSKLFALKPTDFIGAFPKILKKPGEEVKAGTTVFYDKYRENIRITSPVSGKVTDIIRGEKRKVLEIRIEADGKDEYEDFGSANPADLDRAAIIEKLQKSGVWNLIRQRPYSIVADPELTPKNIFISAFDSAPLAQDYDFILKGSESLFATGLEALAKLTDGKIHLGLKANKEHSSAFTNAKNVELTYYQGPHPAGNIGTQANKVAPINKGDDIWYCDPQAVVTIGRLFQEGRYNAEKIVALAGSEVVKPHYFKIKAGACISPLIKENLTNGELRFISGNVLTGDKIEKDGYLSFYHNMFTVIPEGKERAFFGWLIPSPKKHTFYRTGLSWLTPKKKYRLNTNLNGGERAFVVSGAFEKVFPLDIMPIPLIKSIMYNDIDEMEQLGIYEVDEEDFALCEYISTSKINIQEIVRNGLNDLRKELS
jgi:Na+-transporting NADH:ubiquinone oxidoreductase subunit A